VGQPTRRHGAGVSGGVPVCQNKGTREGKGLAGFFLSHKHFWQENFEKNIRVSPDNILVLYPFGAHHNWFFQRAKHLSSDS